MTEELPEKIEDHVRSKQTWLRLLYMVLFAACFTLAQGIAIAVIVFQFFYVLLTGKCNQNLLHFGQGLSRYLYAIARYTTYNSDDKPFPFADWPSEAPQADEQ